MKVRWGKLSDDDIARFEGDADKLAGAVQERDCVTREQASDQVRMFTDRQSKATIDVLAERFPIVQEVDRDIASPRALRYRIDPRAPHGGSPEAGDVGLSRAF